MVFTAGEDTYEYEYDEAKKSNTTGGSRLVGAREAKMTYKNGHEDGYETPFAVAINTQGSVLSLMVGCLFYTYLYRDERFSACTGSLITPTWVVTAAHCTMYITTV